MRNQGLIVGSGLPLLLCVLLVGCGSTADRLLYDGPLTAADIRAATPPPPAPLEPLELTARQRPLMAQNTVPAPVVLPPAEVVSVQAEGMAAKPPPAPADAPEILARVEQWRSAWAGRDLESYLGMYMPTYRGDAASPAQWRANRERVIGQAGNITLSLGEPTIRTLDAGRIETSFVQRYRTEKRSDQGIKRLVWRRVDKRWLIEQESFSPDKS